MELIHAVYFIMSSWLTFIISVMQAQCGDAAGMYAGHECTPNFSCVNVSPRYWQCREDGAHQQRVALPSARQPANRAVVADPSSAKRNTASCWT